MKPDQSASIQSSPGPISAAQSASTGRFPRATSLLRIVADQKFQQGPLGPAAIVGGSTAGREKCAVAAMLRLEKRDVRVGEEGGACLGEHADEGIVERVNDEGGDAEGPGIAGAGNGVGIVIH